MCVTIWEKEKAFEFYRSVDERSPFYAEARLEMTVSDFLDGKPEKAIENAIDPLMEEHPEIFKKAPVYKGVDDLGEEVITLLVTASVNEPDVFEAKRCIQRAIRLSFEKAGLKGA